MKATFLSVTLFLVVLTTAQAQLASTDRPVNQFGTLKQIPLREGKTVGSVYLTDDWTDMDFFFRKGFGVDSATSIQGNLDLKSHQFEVLTKNDVRILPGTKVSHVRVDLPKSGQAIFINCDVFSYKNTRLEGFARLWFEGKISVIEWHGIDIQKPNYNVALDVGSIDETIVKKKILYFVDGKIIYPATENTILNIAGDKRGEVKAFIKKNKLKFKDPQDLARVAEFCSGLK